MMKKIILFTIFLISTFELVSQNLPQNRRVDWTLAGVKDSTTFNFPILNVLDYGLVNDGQTKNDSSLSYIIQNEINQGAVLYFPKGEYLFQDNIILEDNTIIKGAGSDSTIFILDMDTNHHGFKIQGEVTSDTSLLSENALREDNYLVIQNPMFYQQNDWIQIIQNDSNLVTSSWALNTVGQIVQIKSISNDTLWLKSPLRLDYELLNAPFIVKYLPKQNIGFECFKILRLDNTAPFQSSNIYFNKAVNCWVKGIESENCTFSHIQARYSSNIQISNSYFHEAFEYGGNGRAYGVMLHLTTNECIVENSIFKHLRHSMILQAGANANVFAYNYSIEPYRVEFPFDFAGDMVLHGNYPYANLFEHNICQNLSVDNSHGPNGPYNTFFRNRAELWGIYFTSNNSPSQNLIGNEVTSITTPYINLNYTIEGNSHYLYANNDNGIIKPNVSDTVSVYSYAYNSKPNFLNNKAWSFIGNSDSFDIGNIPSKTRFLDTVNTNAYCIDEKVIIENDTILETSNSYLENQILIFPNPSSGIVNLKTNQEIEFVELFNVTGIKQFHKKINTSTFSIDISDLSSGIYTIKLLNNKGEILIRKLVLK